MRDWLTSWLADWGEGAGWRRRGSCIVCVGPGLAGQIGNGKRGKGVWNDDWEKREREEDYGVFGF